MRDGLIQQFSEALKAMLIAQPENASAEEFKNNVLEFFSEEERKKQVLSVHEIKAIIRKTLTKLHPDHLGRTLLNHANIIETLQNLRNHTWEANPVKPKQKAAPSVNLTGTFQTAESERYLEFLAGTKPDFATWIEANKNVLSPYMNFVIKVLELPTLGGGNRMFYTSNLNTLLLRIMMLEYIIDLKNKSAPSNGKKISAAEIIASYDLKTYPKECTSDPLLWLYNEIIINNFDFNPAVRADSEEQSHLVSTNPINSLYKFIDSFDKYPNIASLTALIHQSWPKELLHVKSVLEVTSDFFEKDNYMYAPKDTVQLEGSNLNIKSDSDLHVQLLDFRAFNPTSTNDILPLKKLGALEEWRQEILSLIENLPTTFLCAIAKVDGNELFSDNKTIGTVLSENLALANFLINQTRTALGYLAEPESGQITLEMPPVAMLPTYEPRSGTMLYYKNTVEENNFTSYKKDRPDIMGNQYESARQHLFLETSDSMPVDSMPAYPNPLAVKILRECLLEYHITNFEPTSKKNYGYSINSYYRTNHTKEEVCNFINGVFTKYIGPKLKPDPETEALFKYMADHYFERKSVAFFKETFLEVLKSRESYPAASVYTDFSAENEKQFEEIADQNEEKICAAQAVVPESQVSGSEKSTVETIVQKAASNPSETNSASNFFKPESSTSTLNERALIAQFNNAHKESLPTNLFSFKKTSTKSDWTLKEILSHAMSDNNRSRSVCVALEWLKADGTLNDKAPDAIRTIANETKLSFLTIKAK